MCTGALFLLDKGAFPERRLGSRSKSASRQRFCAANPARIAKSRPAYEICGLGNANLSDRVDVLDAAQFLTVNVLERSLFRVADCKVTLTRLLERYNEIVASCETDPTLKVEFHKERLNRRRLTKD